MVRLASGWSSSPYLVPIAGEWQRVAIADLNGDGNPELIIGRRIFTMAVAHDPTVLVPQPTLLHDGFYIDAAPAAGDFNGDGKPDILLKGSYSAKDYIYLNQCTPTTFAFQEVEIAGFHKTNISSMAVADLNGDGLKDVLTYDGIWYNHGTPSQWAFDLAPSIPVPVTGALWQGAVASDQGCTLYLFDGDGDGLADLYLSSFGNSVWQGVFYKNTGTAQAPAFTYQAPLVCRSTPYDHFYRSSTTPNISGKRIYLSVADVNRDGLPDPMVSDGQSNFTRSTVLWNRSAQDGRHFAWHDNYTYFTAGYPSLDPFAGLGWRNNWLADLALLLADQNGDGLEDLVRAQAWMSEWTLYLLTRTSLYPFTFNMGTDYFKPGIPLLAQGGQAITGLGLAVIDVDRDGQNDWVLGSKSSLNLIWHRNVGTNAVPVFANAVPLPGPGGTPYNLGANLWPASVDVDGDGELEIVVGNQQGDLHILKYQGGFHTDLGRVGANGWNPVDLSGGIFGGDVITASPAATDLDGDGKVDILAGAVNPSAIWYLRNMGQPGSLLWDPQFLSIDRTIPGSVSKVDNQTYRLYFGFPPIPGETRVFFHPQWNNKENVSLIIQDTGP
jgi:hypothetical protein